MIARILILVLSFFSIVGIGYSAGSLENDIHIRDITIDTSANENAKLDTFISPIKNFFFESDIAGGGGVLSGFAIIAKQIKDIMVALAVIFLALAVIKLLFSSNDEESVKKWRRSIIWVSAGIFVMQIAYNVWTRLILSDSTQQINGGIAGTIWVSVFAPIIGLLQMLASFAFLAMAIYAFFTIVTGAGDEEKAKKGKKTAIYALIGFFLIRIPKAIIDTLYGSLSGSCASPDVTTTGSCEIANQNISGTVEIIGKIITYMNGFLMLVCVLLVIYAGWLVLISAGDEEKLKKAKNTILYACIGFIILIASHAIFRFFILQA